MDMEKLLKFSVDQDIDFEEIENAQFSKVKMKIYSADRVNAHGYTISLKNLKKYAHTIGGKPIVAYISPITNDTAGHEEKEMPMGFVPFEPEISYETSEDGTIFLCVIGYIWNIYCQQLVNIFEDSNGVKGLSCEMLILDSEVIEDTGVEEILAYSFAGLTILGNFDAKLRPIVPAVEGCDATLIQNSVNAFEEAKIEFEKILYSTEVKDSGHSEFLINTNEEDIMEENIKTNSPEIVENANVETTDNAYSEVETSIDVETHKYNYDDDGCFTGSEHERHIVSETHYEEVPEENQEPVVVNAEEAEEEVSEEEPVLETNADEDPDVESEEEEIEEEETSDDEGIEDDDEGEPTENSVTKEEFDAVVQKCGELEKVIEVQNAQIEALTFKCSTLEEYKLNKETESMKKVLNSALSSVAHILSSDQMDSWREEATKCSIDKVDEFTNKLKAFAFDLQEKKGVQQIDSIRNSIANEVEDDSSFSVWDRLERKYV